MVVDGGRNRSACVDHDFSVSIVSTTEVRYHNNKLTKLRILSKSE